MFPIRDENPTRHRPVLTVVIIAACVAVFFFLQPTSQEASVDFMYANAAVSCELVTGEPLSVEEIQTGRCSNDPAASAFPDKSIVLSVLTSIFLHAGLGHLFANMWSLWIFGNNIEDRLRGLRFIGFYLGSGIVATGVFVVMNPGETVPLIGASGAIAGVMGAYLVLYPTARLVTIVPPFFFLPFRIPAMIFLLFWFGFQFLISSTAGQVAWEAHVGGFVAGAVYALVFRRSLRERPRRSREAR